MDCRELHKDKVWTRGRVLNAHRMTFEEAQHHLSVEECCAFANFHERDEGRSREFVYRWPTAEEA